MKKILLQPFEHYRERHLLMVGIPCLFLGSYLAYLLNARFDGAIDLHVVNSITWHEPFTDNLINSLCLTLFLGLFGKISNKKTRWIDVLAVSLVARIPLYVLPVFNLNNAMVKTSQQLLDNFNSSSMNLESADINFGLLLVFALVSIMLIVYVIYLLYQGYKIASNAKGGRATVFFILAFILAELSSKYIIYLITT